MMRKHLTAALLFLALTLVLTNPLVLHVWNSVEDKQDGFLNTWIVAWVGHALTTDPLNLFNTNIFFPYQNTLAYSEILLPASLVALPLTLAANNPILGYNVALLAMLWLDAFAMYLFVYDLTRRSEAGWIAGAIYAFNPFNLGNFAQMQLLTLGFLPLALLFLGRILNSEITRAERGQRLKSLLQNCFLFALFFVAQALSSFYYALLAGFAVGVYLVWWLITQRKDWARAVLRVILPLAGAFVLIGLALLPFLLPYFQVQQELGFARTVQDSEPFSAALKQFTEVAPQNALYGNFLAPNPIKRVGGYALDNLFPGLVAVGLAIAGVAMGRRREKYFLIGLLAVSFVLALGPRLYLTSTQATDITLPYRWLYDLFSPLRALRAPVRFDALINFALAGLAGLGVVPVLARIEASRNGRARHGAWVALGVVGVIALEYLALPAANIVTVPVANEIPAVEKWLAQQPHTVVLELPMMGPNAQKELDISTQYFTTYHWQDTPDGYSGFIPPRRGEVAYEMQEFPSARSIALLRGLGVKYVIDNTPVEQCYVFAGAVGSFKPEALPEFKKPCVYEFPSIDPAKPSLTKHLFVPSAIEARSSFKASLILGNSNVSAFAVKPTDTVKLEVSWDGGAVRTVSVPLPLVTSSVSVVSIPLTAPAKDGHYALRIQSKDPLIGATDVTTFANVGEEFANEVVLPARVELTQPLQTEAARGETIAIPLRWLPLNKISAYYSASIRLVKANGEKVANVDRQPALETFLWRPEESVEDSFSLPIPPDIPAGNYRIEVLMYQADTDVSAYLLDKDNHPQPSIKLGEIQVK